MDIINIPIVQASTELEFRQIFENELADAELYFEGYRLKIIKEDFDHTCFEKGKGGESKVQFGVRRARRMLLIKSICNKSIPYKLLWQTERADKTVCVLCEEAEVAIYLKARKTKAEDILIFKTLIAFGDNIEKRMKKQKENSQEIECLERVFKEAV